MVKMTPEQRAQMEKAMGGNLPPGMLSGKPDTAHRGFAERMFLETS